MSHQFTRSSLYRIAILFSSIRRLFDRVCLRGSRVGSIVPNNVCVIISSNNNNNNVHHSLTFWTTDDHRESAFLFQRTLIQRFNAVAVLGTFAPTTPQGRRLAVPAFLDFSLVFNPRDLYYRG